MTHRTLKLSSIDEYLRDGGESDEDLQVQMRRRHDLMLRFPHPIMLMAAVPEFDFANRWCWNEFGPAHGQCIDSHSRYRVCDQTRAHSHNGEWASSWFTKIDYDFGFCEWYFLNRQSAEKFEDAIPSFNWGEDFPVDSL
jgi:hypothetical protein